MPYWDHSYIREGRDLAEWISDLCSANKQQQLHAAEVIQAIMQGRSSIHADSREMDGTWPEPGHYQRAEDRLRNILDSDDFPVRTFYEHAVNWLRPNKNCRGINQARMNTAVTWHLLIVNASPRLLQERDIVEQLLDVVEWCALRWLMRMGTRAVHFTDYFLKQLDQTDTRRYCYADESLLAVIGADNPELVEALYCRLHSEDEHSRYKSAYVLGHMAPRCAGRNEELFDKVNQLYRASPEENALYYYDAWASLGRHKPEVRQEVLAQTLPKPPVIRIHKTEGGSAWEYDQVMYDRSTAIDACQFFVDWPEEAVPVLAKSLTTFEEYDPDFQNNGDHGRVCHVLAKFGKHAIPVLPQVLVLMRAWLDSTDPHKELCKDLIRLTGAMGPSAKEALPLLYQLRWTDDQNEPLDESFDTDKAIMAIQESRLICS